MDVITVNRLTKKFGSFTAVDAVSFAVKRGEIFGFLGANGAGKSTTIRMLCGLLAPSSGIAIVGGYDITREPEMVKRSIGYMSQKFSLYDDLTVEENIEFFGGIYGLSDTGIRSRKQWALEIAGLSGMGGRITKKLAGGWKQRLALGCALLHEPEIVFLDEPTGGVDPLSRRKFWDLIQTLSSAGVTVFVTTHYLDEAEYCNTIMLIQNGEIVAGGSPGELKSTYIRNPVLEVDCDDLTDTLQLLEKQKGVLEISVFGSYLHVSVENENEGKAMIERILKEKDRVTRHIERIMPSLEDVFLHVIEHPKKGKNEE